MNHIHRPSRAGSLLAAALASATALAGCDPAPATRSQADATGSASTQASPSAHASTGSAPPFYKPVRDPCTVVDHQLLASALGPRTGDGAPPRSFTALQLTQSMCSATYGSSTDRTLISVEIDVSGSENVSAAVMFEGLKAAVEGDEQTSDVPSLGERAYSYANPETGPHVVALDGNLTIRMRAVSVAGAPRSDGELLSLLTEVEKRVLSQLTRS